MRINYFSVTNCFGFSDEGLMGNGIAGKLQLRDFNLIIGKNDSGKSGAIKAMLVISNLLKEWLSQVGLNNIFMERQFSSINVGYYKITKLNLLFHNKEIDKNIEYEIEYKIEKDLHKLLYGFLPLNPFKHIKNENDYSIRFKGYITHRQNAYYFYVESFDFYLKNHTEKTELYSSKKSNLEKDSGKQEYISPLADFFHALAGSLQSIVYVPPIREFKEIKFQNASGEPGEKIRQKLSTLKEGDEKDFKQFRLFEKFVLNLTQDGKSGQNRRIVLPANDETGISNDKNVLPLSSYGSGVEQLFTIAANTVMHGTHRLVIIEEPEAHLHPDLQRSLFQYLIDSNHKNEETKDKGLFHQYIILSHSSVFINEMLDKKAQIIRAYKKDPTTNQTMLVDLQTEGTEKILEDLGVKGSDLLQSNGIIWVEGPSDRIYIQKWLELYYLRNGIKDTPRENIDYSFAFYGGSILNWFNVEDDLLEESQVKKETDNFINLIKINRHALIIMDRDQESGKKWNTKERINSEISKIKNTQSLITDGKEIENYLTKDNVKRSYPELSVSRDFTINSKTAFNELLVNKIIKENNKDVKKGTHYKVNKAIFASNICEKMTIEDLVENKLLIKLVETIYSLLDSWRK